jgi:glycosyltransferase involved in cell wall biosynthesis
MAQRHTVDLLSFMAPGDSLPTDSPLFDSCRRIAIVPQPERATQERLKLLFTSTLPDMALRLEAVEMHLLIQRWLNDAHYDIVQIEGIELAQYARHVDSTKSAVIFDDHNCEYLLQKRNALSDLRVPRRWHAAAYSLIQWAKLRRYEAQVCKAATAVLAVSQPDQVALQQIAPDARVHIAPNGIDLSSYAPIEQDSRINKRDARAFTLLFTGKMDYRPNIDAILWFANEVLPNLLIVAPQIRLQVVGLNPHPRLDKLRQNPNIEISGAVPDILPYLKAADAYIIPMRVGGGTRFKALEAMAARKAIVSTSLGVEGIGVQAGEHLLIADAPDEFAVSILTLLADQRDGSILSTRLGQNAYEFVSANYTWDRIIPTIDRVYTQVRSSQNHLTQRPLSPPSSGTPQNQPGVKL